ncbi:ComEC/Rec2 family competence protein [Nocardioides islandensis]|uniref:ComEC/Rec2 family competence protein n=2 Tax=Nocardioides islandensis TaxID=433663 RepID=A0A930YCE8_9ACTN|nr:ComEC/Rec2 family competence protein [Nocardioides islandensis]
MPLLGLAAWAGSLLAGAPWAVAATVLASLVVVAIAWRRAAWTAIGMVVVCSAVLGVALARAQAVRDGPVAEAARARAVATLTGTVAGDPRVVEGRFGPQVLVRVAVGRHQPVLVFGDADWRRVAVGERVRLTGRLGTSDDGDVAALVTPRGPPEVLGRAGVGWRATEALRASIRDSVAQRPEAQRALVPALVDGDDAGMPEELTEDFRTTGLTHLTAVSGTNLTLVVGFLLVVARWSGVRGRWLGLVGVAGIVGFVLLARTEPSVLRAAAMGAVALVGLGRGGWHRGVRGLGVAVVGLLLLDPPLGMTAGFALSVLATAGILLVAPAWRDALARWLPRWLAEAVAVPAAAQLACTPLVAALSGQVSLVAVLANLLVAPVVGPATVLGLLGGLVGLLVPPLGRLVGTSAAWCVAWIVEVAERGAGLPGAALDWGTSAWSLTLVVAVTAVVLWAGPWVLRRRTTGAAACVLLLAVTVLGPPTPGWPPDGWVFAACDVGQGDALALRAGPGAAVVVDSGPDPRLVDACLRRLGVGQVPLLVLTHFHADHVDGIAGVLSHRDVHEVEVTRLADPPGGVAEVAGAARSAGLTPEPATYGRTLTVGDVTLQVLWPTPDSPTTGPGDGSTANEASVVLLAEVGGVRLLLTGDVEPEGQQALARLLPGLRVDVLKVPHHGSRYQDLDWLDSLHARLAVVSVGADNDYGHPAAGTLDDLTAHGTTVLRTDRDGDVVVAVRDGRLVAVTTD